MEECWPAAAAAPADAAAALPAAAAAPADAAAALPADAAAPLAVAAAAAAAVAVVVVAAAAAAAPASSALAVLPVPAATFAGLASLALPACVDLNNAVTSFLHLAQAILTMTVASADRSCVTSQFYLARAPNYKHTLTDTQACLPAWTHTNTFNHVKAYTCAQTHHT